jgi:Rieske Fe-S protein
MVDRTSRRKILQVVASIPAVGLGLMPAALSRECSDDSLPDKKSAKKKKGPAAIFHEDDLQAEWTCLPFVLKGAGDNHADASGDERGYLIKLPSGNLVAYRRVCSKHGCKFEYLKKARDCKHRLHEGVDAKSLGAVLTCQCHGSVFDLLNGGKVIGGLERERPRSFAIKRCHDKICVLPFDSEAGT